MVGGKIKDFFQTKEVNGDISWIKFLVKGVDMERNDYCCVTAEVPNSAMTTGMVKIGLPIWWHNPNVYIKIEETEDVAFKKIGVSGGDQESFYKQKGNNSCGHV